MSVPLTEKIRDFLVGRGPATPERVAEAIPELAENGGAQRALLLMRLDSTLERTGPEMWAARGTVLLTEARRFRQAAESYFKTLSRPGAPLSSAVKVIAAQTRLCEHRVEDLLRQRYKVVGTNVFNRPNNSGVNVQ